MNNVVIVSGGQQWDSAINAYVSILPQIPLPSRLLHNIEQSSMSYTVGPWLSILNILVCRKILYWVIKLNCFFKCPSMDVWI